MVGLWSVTHEIPPDIHARFRIISMRGFARRHLRGILTRSVAAKLSPVRLDLSRLYSVLGGLSTVSEAVRVLDTFQQNVDPDIVGTDTAWERLRKDAAAEGWWGGRTVADLVLGVEQSQHAVSVAGRVDRVLARRGEARTSLDQSPLMVLVHGEFGSGTTTLARAICIEAGLNVVAAWGSELRTPSISGGRMFTIGKIVERLATAAQPMALLLDELHFEDNHPSPVIAQELAVERLLQAIDELPPAQRPMMVIACSAGPPCAKGSNLWHRFEQLAIPKPHPGIRRQLILRAAQELGAVLGSGVLEHLVCVTGGSSGLEGQRTHTAGSIGHLVADLVDRAHERGNRGAGGRGGPVELGLELARSRCPAPPIDVDPLQGIVGHAPAKRVLWDRLLGPLEAYQRAEDRVEREAALTGLAKGIILHGSPGTGKSMTARALARAAEDRGAVVRRILGTEVRSKWIGEGEACIRRLFEHPGEGLMVIVVDEIDELILERGSGEQAGRADEHPNYLSGLVAEVLSRMEGLQDGRDATVVIGTTNRLAACDEAAKAPHRFDVLLSFEPPDEDGIEALFQEIPASRGLMLTAKQRDYGLALGSLLVRIRALWDRRKRSREALVAAGLGTGSGTSPGRVRNLEPKRMAGTHVVAAVSVLLASTTKEDGEQEPDPVTRLDEAFRAGELVGNTPLEALADGRPVLEAARQLEWELEHEIGAMERLLRARTARESWSLGGLMGRLPRARACHQAGHIVATYLGPLGLPVLDPAALLQGDAFERLAMELEAAEPERDAAFVRELMVIALSGMAAEEVLLGRLFDYGARDQEQARLLGLERVTRYRDSKLGVFPIRHPELAGAGVQAITSSPILVHQADDVANELVTEAMRLAKERMKAGLLLLELTTGEIEAGRVPESDALMLQATQLGPVVDA